MNQGKTLRIIYWLLAQAAAALILLTGCAAPVSRPTTWQEFISGTATGPTLQLHYETYGQGDPVILLHGLGANIYSWRHLIKPLEDRHRVIVFDLKGFGLSPKPPDGHYSMFDQAELIYRFIIAKDLTRLTLVGHSFGGAVAMLVAAKLLEQHPGRIERLVVIDTVSYPQKLPPMLRLLRTPVLGGLGMYLIPDRVKVRNLLRTIYYDPSKITPEQITAYAAPLSLPGAKYAMRQSARQLIPENLGEVIAQYPKITVPTLIIWGAEDHIIPLALGERLHQAIPDSKLVIIPRCGHDPPEECPVPLLEVLQPFLEGKNPPQQP